MLIAIIIITFLILCAIPGVAACMRSSQISQMQEKMALERRLNEVCKQQKTYSVWGFDTVSTMIAKGKSYDDPDFLSRD